MKPRSRQPIGYSPEIDTFDIVIDGIAAEIGLHPYKIPRRADAFAYFPAAFRKSARDTVGGGVGLWIDTKDS